MTCFFPYGRIAVRLRSSSYSDQGEERVKEAYSKDVWGRLVQIKKKDDPNNLLRMNQKRQKDGYCPECFEVDGQKRDDFEKIESTLKSSARYRCEECGDVFGWVKISRSSKGKPIGLYEQAIVAGDLVPCNFV